MTADPGGRMVLRHRGNVSREFLLARMSGLMVLPDGFRFNYEGDLYFIDALSSTDRDRLFDALASRVADADDRAAAAHASAQNASLDALSATCPLPLEPGRQSLPGGLHLQPDEFLVAAGRDWGLSSQRLTLTTHRLIYSHGRLGKEQKIAYLTDIRDVVFHKPALGFGTIVIDTASGRIEGLPSMKNGRAFRDALLSLVHWARQRAQQPQTVVVQQPSASRDEDIPAKLEQLAGLRDASIISQEEFEAKKAELLARM